MGSKFILGGGAAGLIAAYYKKDYTIVSPNLSGQLGNPWPLGPRYLHCTTEVEDFLASLKLPTMGTVVTVGYADNDTFITPTNEDIAGYWKKTRGTKMPTSASCMMSGKECFEVMALPLSRVVSLLAFLARSRWTTGDVRGISLEKKEILLNDSRVVPFTKLINTLPASVFTALIEGGNKDADFSFEPSYLFYGYSYDDTVLYRFLWSKGVRYDFIYFPRTPRDLLRITKLDEPWFVAETVSSGGLPMEAFIEDAKFLPIGKIVGGGEAFKKRDWSEHGIAHFGQWAQWEDGLLAHDLIEEMQKSA